MKRAPSQRKKTRKEKKFINYYADPILKKPEDYKLLTLDSTSNVVSFQYLISINYRSFLITIPI
jgi:hypothetical protein